MSLLVEFSGVKAINLLLTFDHQNTMEDWLIIENVAVGISIPYSYEKSRF